MAIVDIVGLMEHTSSVKESKLLINTHFLDLYIFVMKLNQYIRHIQFPYPVEM